jgi:hypothetical protein
MLRGIAGPKRFMMPMTRSTPTEAKTTCFMERAGRPLQFIGGQTQTTNANAFGVSAT